MNINISYFYISPVLMWSIFMGFSMNSFFNLWMMLELNLIMFLLALNMEKSVSSSESAMKYFFIQAIASSSLMWGYLVSHLSSFSISILIIISLSVLLKLGASPFHMWYIKILQKMSWLSFFLATTTQKLLPLYLISLFMPFSFFMGFIFLSAIVGAISILSQTQIKGLFAFSSLFNLSWMMASCMMILSFFGFFILYSFTLIMTIFMISVNKSQNSFSMGIFSLNPLMKMMFFVTILSVAGLPPFLGFWAKILVLKLLMQLKYFSMGVILLSVSSLPLYAYMNLVSPHLPLNPSAKLHPSYFLSGSLSISLILLLPMMVIFL